MRKFIVLFLLAAMVESCSDNKPEAATPKKETAPDLSSNPDYKKGLDLVNNMVALKSVLLHPSSS